MDGVNGVNVFHQFVATHKAQLESSNVPKHLWDSLYRKLTNEIYDAAQVMQLMLIEYDDETTAMAKKEDNRPVFALTIIKENGISANDSTAIYLIDHAWTFRIQSARNDLQQYENLLDRMCTMMGVNLDMVEEERLQKVLKSMWLYCQSYSLKFTGEGRNDDSYQSVWYIMDEVGSAVTHSDEPNFRIVPFLYMDSCTTYSLLFPINDCHQGDIVARDFIEYVPKYATERQILLLPWHFIDVSDYNFIQNEPPVEYFMSGHILETYPVEEELAASQSPSTVNFNRSLKVYAEYDVLISNLTSHSFTLVNDPDDADILWLTKHFTDFEAFSQNSSHKFINQFPCEYVITIKDLLAIICRRSTIEHHDKETLETYPLWLPTTYNLKSELQEFVSYFQNLSKRNLDNHWIIKPWNLARGLDTYITDNIAQILRLSATGPKIAQKYIERPVLFYRPTLNAYVKFDIRYILLLKSVKPLEAYIYRKFFLRFSNKEFKLDDLDNYERHFTVMNYQNNGAGIHHIKCEEFLQVWHEQYPNYPWPELEDKICKMLYEMLECATNSLFPPPCSIAPCAQSRAMYAVDIMLELQKKQIDNNKRTLDEEVMQPKLLEVNWTPDCKRACDYYPEFFNDIFKLLFLNEYNEKVFSLLDKNTTITL